jgi:glyoxylase-like metal-dependent hydrolase (beta-lactamase superfamily II)
VIEIGPGAFLADIDYLGEPEHIAAAVLECADGLAVVDPGPATGIDGLRRRLAARGATLDDVASILLTHIHLDHAGACGVLVREHPGIRIFVHERGARHVADPARLLESATRLYGDHMDRLWGEVAAVPESSIITLAGGERLAPGGRRIRVEYTPGHAWHHVAYFDERSGIAFVGDTGGERFRDAPYVLPVTPPPDIDLEAWADSFARIRAWDAAQLFVTHFGACTRPAWHLDALIAELADWAERVRASLAEPGSDEERAARFQERVWERIEASVPADVVHLYHGGAPDTGWHGLARYWRKRLAAS